MQKHKWIFLIFSFAGWHNAKLFLLRGTGEMWQEIEVLLLGSVFSCQAPTGHFQFLQHRWHSQNQAPASAEASPNPSFCSAVWEASPVLHSYATDGFTAPSFFSVQLSAASSSQQLPLTPLLGSAKLENNSQDHPHFWHQLQKLEVPKTALTSYTTCKFGSFQNHL